MKKIMIAACVIAALTALGETSEEGWSIKDTYDRTYVRNLYGWVKGGTMAGGQSGIDRTSGKMTAPTALWIRQKDRTGEMEIKKTFPIPEDRKGKGITVEIFLGYNFVNEYRPNGPNAPGGQTWASIIVRLLDRRGEMITEKSLSKSSALGGDLEGTLEDMATNWVKFEAKDTDLVESVQVVLGVKVEANGNKPRKQTCMAELWIQTLTIR